ncbi:LPXTG cell wall anchor domain-containing protein [Patescibacteria group bacterium]|nr:LPXTG cell wall anchor domain-containing protein [Patescibacteria group bacterium]
MGILGSNIDLMQYLNQAVFWIAIIGIVLIIGIGSFYVRKRQRLIYNCHIYTNIGNKKAGIESTKAGWFKPKWFLKLYDYGGQAQLQTADGRKILTGGSNDFHEINGKRGLLLRRKDDDPAMLVPMTEFETKNYEMLGAIAPVDLTDAGVSLIRQAKEETKSKMEEYIMMAIRAVEIIFFFIAIVMIIQFCQRAITEAKDLVLEVARQGCNSPAVQALIKGGTL